MTAPVPTGAVVAAEMGTDAMRWAQEFTSRFQIRRRADKEVMETSGLMLGWFANAIEAGRDAGAAAERERCQELIRAEAAKWRDSAIKAPDAEVASEYRYIAASVDAAADLLRCENDAVSG